MQNYRIGDIQENLANFIMSNLHKVKIGEIVRLSEDKSNATINFKIKVNHDNEYYDLPLLECRIFKSQVNYHYKINQKVLVLFTDDNENKFLSDNKTKTLKDNLTARKHALINGLIIAPYQEEIQDERVVFDEDKIEIKNKEAKVVFEGDKIQLKNSKISLKELLNTIVSSFKENVIITSPVGVCEIDTTAWEEKIKLEINKLMN